MIKLVHQSTKMSEGNKKLIFLIKKFCSSLNITEDTEDNINLLIQNILIQHKEFLRIPKSDFKENITKGLMEHLKPQKKDGNQSQNEVNSKLSVTTTPATPMKKRKRPQSTTSTEPMESAEDNMTSTSSFLISRPTARLSDLAGLDNVIKQVREMVFFPIQLPELYQHLGVSPPSGLLLHGPSGCGKTTLASAIAGELGLPFLKVFIRMECSFLTRCRLPVLSLLEELLVSLNKGFVSYSIKRSHLPLRFYFLMDWMSSLARKR
jgi:ATP-dependent Clp protease ATP-binding subunit ClpA